MPEEHFSIQSIPKEPTSSSSEFMYLLQKAPISQSPRPLKVLWNIKRTWTWREITGTTPEDFHHLESNKLPGALWQFRILIRETRCLTEDVKNWVSVALFVLFITFSLLLSFVIILYGWLVSASDTQSNSSRTTLTVRWGSLAHLSP